MTSTETGCTRKKVTKKQQKVMVTFIENHPIMNRERGNTTSEKEEIDALWEQLAEQLNADETGPSKPTYKWMKTWADWKMVLKRNSKKRKTYKKQGLTDECFRNPTPLEARVEALMGLQKDDVDDDEVLEVIGKNHVAMGDDPTDPLSTTHSEKEPSERTTAESVRQGAYSLMRIADAMERNATAREEQNEIFRTLISKLDEFLATPR